MRRFGSANNHTYGNVLAGTIGDGVFLVGSNNEVDHNRVGTTAAGSAAIANVIGVRVAGGIGNLLHDNQISGNSNTRVKLDGSPDDWRATS